MFNKNPSLTLESFFCVTPVGTLRASLCGERLVELSFAEPGETGGAQCPSSEPALRLCTELQEYFRGVRKSFSIEVDFSVRGRLGGFEQRVLRELMLVPFGDTISYQKLAERCGCSLGARAVGNAMRKNPVPIVVPCHRVVNADGSIGRYSGGEGVKPFLLDLERKWR